MIYRRNGGVWRSLAALVLSTASLLIMSDLSIKAQGFGNTISGRVIGADRRPVPDINVELLDDFSRTIMHTRTNSSGFYSFSNMSEGRFIVRVMPFASDYEEQENTVEIINVTSVSATGISRTGGFAHEQSDFTLKLKKGAKLLPPEAVFVQDVPSEAQALYDKALVDLSEKRGAQGQVNLRAAIEIFPKYYAALERLGIEYLRMQQPHTDRAAEILFKAAVDVNPADIRAGMAWPRHVFRSDYLQKH
jgi:hypothetical protein